MQSGHWVSCMCLKKQPRRVQKKHWCDRDCKEREAFFARVRILTGEVVLNFWTRKLLLVCSDCFQGDEILIYKKIQQDCIKETTQESSNNGLPTLTKVTLVPEVQDAAVELGKLHVDSAVAMTRVHSRLYSLQKTTGRQFEGKQKSHYGALYSNESFSVVGPALENGLEIWGVGSYNKPLKHQCFPSSSAPAFKIKNKKAASLLKRVQADHMYLLPKGKKRQNLNIKIL